MSAPLPSPQRKKLSSGPIVAIVILVAAVIVIGVPIVFCAVLASKAPRIEENSVITLRLDGDIPEAPSQNPFDRIGSAAKGGTLALADMRRLVAAAKDDSRIDGVLIQIGPIEAAWAMGTLEEERELITELRKSKRVDAFLVGDMVDLKSYYVASACEHITASPTAFVHIAGTMGAATFWRGTLDKLDIVPQFIMFKEYKSAGEPFQNQHMSPAFHEWLRAVLNEYWDRFEQATFADRKIEKKDKVKALFDRGAFTAQEAMDAKLIDRLGYYDDAVLQAAGKALPETGEADPQAKLPHPVTGQHYLAAHKGYGHGEKVAAIYAVGPITSAFGADGLFGGEGISGPDLAEAIRDAADDKDVKAIVMRVNSPGGSAVGSDFIRREVDRAKAKKPFVVSMGGVAGSGGYWIAMDADSIVAQPSTVTGSIGVVFGKFNLMGFYNQWLHANIDTETVGPNALMLSEITTMTPQQEQTLKDMIGSDYKTFVQHVADGRKMTFDQTEPLAHGRVWTGKQALDRKLVDELGGFAEALEIAKDKAGLKGQDTQLVTFPREKPFLQQLLENLDASTARPDLKATLERVKADMETPQVLAIMPEIRIQ